MEQQHSYSDMWEIFGKTKSEGLMTVKFEPNHRIGLTNFLREQWIFRMLPISNQDVVADIGCASGRQVFLAARHAQRAIGTDIAQSFIDYANTYKQTINATNTEFITAPIEKLPIETASVDKLICSEVIEHILDPEEALKELHRILKPKGLALITVPNMNADGTWLGRFLRLLHLRSFTPITAFSMTDIEKHGDAHVREFTVATLGEFLQKHHFRPIRSTTVSMIDAHDRVLNRLLRMKWFRTMAIRLENNLSDRQWHLGRHIIMLCEKN